MARIPFLHRLGNSSICLVAVVSMLGAMSFDVHAQSGAVYRCGSNDYTNALSENEAVSRHCAKIGNAEWVFSGSDLAGRQYTYNDRRTVVREDGTVETWLQVVAPRMDKADSSDWQTLPYVRTVSPHVIHCRERTISSGATYFVNLRDNSVTKDSSMRTAAFPPPERIAEALMRRLCPDHRAGEESLASR
jgi:hypothetical protein